MLVILEIHTFHLLRDDYIYAINGSHGVTEMTFQQVHGSIVTTPWQCHPSPHVLRPIPKASVTQLHWIESDRGSPKWREVSFDDTTSAMANVPMCRL